MRPPARPARNVSKPTTYSENGTRRSSATVQAEREATANKKAQQDEVAKKASRSAAQRESESQDRARRLKENPGGTPAAALPPKADRTRPARADIADPDARPKPKKRKVKKIIYETASEGEDDEGDDETPVADPLDGESDPRFDAEMRELDEASGGSDTYVPPADEDNDEESDHELDIELEDDECDTALEKRRGGKKKGKQGKGEKPGVSLRKEIQTFRDGSPDTPTPRNGSSVRKGSKSKSASHEGRVGMRPNYKPGPPLLPNLKRKADVEHSDEHEDEEDDGPMQQEGGLFGDVEQDKDEREELMRSSTGSKAITKFSNIDSASKYLTKTAVKRSRDGSESSNAPAAKRAKVVDLPEPAKLHWKSIKANIIDGVAGLSPWAELPDAIIVEIWNDHVGDECRITAAPSTDKKHQLFRMVKSLLVNQVLPTEWRFKLRDAAMKAVVAEWALRNLTTKEQRAHFASIMLGQNPRDRASEDRPFVYSSTDDPKWDGESDPSETGDGVLEGRMVLRTLSVHAEIVGSLVSEEKRTKRLYGALGLAIQAINRALEYSLTGAMVIPDQKTGHFSAENWADFMSTTEKDGKTVRKHVRRATMWMGTMEHCPDAGWARIIDGAKSFSSATLKKENTLKATRHVDDDSVEMPKKRVIGFNSAWATPASGSSSPRHHEASSDASSVQGAHSSDV